jgi:PAS domain S-box-containing protein
VSAHGSSFTGAPTAAPVPAGDAPSVESLLERVARLADEIDAFERRGGATPLHLNEAIDGGAMSRLAGGVERLSQRIATQLATLDRLARQRRDLLTNVSHDLRTPLASMQGYLELLLLRHANLEPAERHNYLETAARQSERLSRLVGDLFQLAELDGDDVAFDSEDFALTELAQDVVQTHSAEAIRRRVDLRLAAGAARLAANGDIGLVERVLSALVDNALRHTPPGGSVAITIGSDPSAQRAAVRVSDTGEGIAEADLQGLFDRYDRVERVAGASPTPHGGLGLAIARRIVQLHGGALQVTSRAGEGTEVSFDLPLAARAGAAPRPAAQGSAAGAQALAPQAGRIAQLEQHVAEQRRALERSEAARASAEADLRAVEQRYLLALRGSQDGLWEWQLGTDRVLLSPRWKSMLGFESHEIADDREGWFGRVHPDDRAGLDAALRAHLDAAAVGDRSFDHPLRLLHKDGSVRHVLSRGVAIRSEDGVPYRMVGLDTDVTRVKRLQTVLDALADGTADARGEAFLPALVRNFARALDVDLAFIAECIDEPPTRVRTLAAWNSARGDVANFEFALAGTPCEAVIQDGRSCFHRDDLERMFPRERGYAAYLGMPIVGADGRVLGHLAFFDREPRGDEMLVSSVYRIFLARAAEELQRRRDAAAPERRAISG